MMASEEPDDRKRTDTPTSENHGTLIFQDFELSAQWDTTGHVLRVAMVLGTESTKDVCNQCVQKETQTVHNV